MRPFPFGEGRFVSTPIPSVILLFVRTTREGRGRGAGYRTQPLASALAQAV